MAVQPKTRHRYTSSDPSVGGNSVGSFGSFDLVNVSSCYDDDSIVSEYERMCLERGQTVGGGEGNVHPFTLPSPPPAPNGDGNEIPLRRRLGAGDSIIAATSPEIRALNLPFTPPVRGSSAYRGRRSLSPSTSVTTDGSMTSSPALSQTRTNMSSLLDSLESKVNGKSTVNQESHQEPMNTSTKKAVSKEKNGSRAIPGSWADRSHQREGRCRVLGTAAKSQISIPSFSDEVKSSNDRVPSTISGKIGSTGTIDKENKAPKLPPIHRPSRHSTNERENAPKKGGVAVQKGASFKIYQDPVPSQKTTRTPSSAKPLQSRTNIEHNKLPVQKHEAPLTRNKDKLKLPPVQTKNSNVIVRNETAKKGRMGDPQAAAPFRDRPLSHQFAFF